MPYTNVWNSSAPPGSQAANTADDEFRKFRLDLEERMEDKFVTDITLDPLVVKPEILGNVTGKARIIHFSGFTFDTLMTFENASVRGFLGVTTKGRHALILPVGVTITSAYFRVERFSAATITATLSYVDVAQVVTNVFSITDTTSTGVADIGSGAIAHAVTGFRAYYLGIIFDQDVRLYEAGVTYNVPDCRNTL